MIDKYSAIFKNYIDKVSISDSGKKILEYLLYEEHRDLVLPPVLEGDLVSGQSVHEWVSKKKHSDLSLSSEEENFKNNYRYYESIENRIFYTFQTGYNHFFTLKRNLFLCFHEKHNGKFCIKILDYGFYEPNKIYDFTIDGLLELGLDVFSYPIRDKGLDYNNKEIFDYLKTIKNEIPYADKLSPLYWKLVSYFKDLRVIENKQVSEKINEFLDELKNPHINDINIFIENNEFNSLLEKNQSIISKKNEQYLHNFVKLKRYISNKRQNILSIIEILKKTSYDKDFEITKGIITNEIFLYKSVFACSIVMLLSLKDNEMITFFDIYETLDELKIFNSNWEIEVSQDLKNIDDSIIQNGEMIAEKFDLVINSIYKVGEVITGSLMTLSSNLQSSLENLGNNINSELNTINSSIKFNNLLTGINTYQLYKINKNI